MLSHLGLTNFGPIAQADFDFVPGMNVLLGENGTGKSLALRAAWLLLAHNGEALHLDEVSGNNPDQSDPPAYNPFIFHDLVDEFRIRNPREVILNESPHALIKIKETTGVQFIAKIHQSNALMVGQDHFTGSNQPPKKPFLLPASDPLAQMASALELLNKHRYQSPPSTLELSRAILINPVREESLAHPMRSLVERTHTQLKGGLPTVDPQGRLLWQNRSIGLMAEGHRKLAAAAMLLANESLQPGGTLFWDEPEANLNPTLLGFLADWLADLAAAGVQVILSTHSLFLVRALIIAKHRVGPQASFRCFSLHQEEGGVVVEQADRPEDLTHFAMLDAEIAQSDAYLATP